MLASQFVIDLQTIISREINPTAPAVITVGSFHCGTKHNIISSSCKLQLTVRSMNKSVRNQLVEAIKRKALAVAASGKAPQPTVVVSSDPLPAVFNDPKLADKLVQIFTRALGADKVVPSTPEMVSEDFGLFSAGGVPIVIFRLGTLSSKRLKQLTREGKEPPALHSEYYAPDIEATLLTSIPVMVQAVSELLAPARN